MVRCLVRKSSDISFLKRLGVEFAYGDVTDKPSLSNALRGVNAVFHLAGLLGKWRVSKEVYHNIHAGGTETLIDICLQQGIRRFIYCSSSGVLGPLQSLANEHSPYNLPTHTSSYSPKIVLAHKHDLDVTVTAQD